MARPKAWWRFLPAGMNGLRGCGSPTRLRAYCPNRSATPSSGSSRRMTRQQLEHVIRASAATADVRDIVVIGSQAILGGHPDAPAELTESMEADVFPKESPERSIVIDG